MPTPLPLSSAPNADQTARRLLETWLPVRRAAYYWRPRPLIEVPIDLMKDDEVHLPVRVLLTILRKLYLQGGSGRKENAFTRGMSNSAGRFVDSLLEIVRREGLATVGTYGANKVWQPVRSQRPRVRRLLESPTATSDPALLEAAKLR